MKIKGKYLILIVTLFFLSGCTRQLTASSKENRNQNLLKNDKAILTKGNIKSLNTSISKQLKSRDTSIYFRISDVDFLSPKIGYLSLLRTKNNNDILEITYKLLKTQDGGYHWTSIENNASIEATFFINDKLGYGKQHNNKNGNDSLENIWVKTMDGGINWSPIEFIKGTKTLQIDIFNKNTMFICTESNKTESQTFLSLKFYKSTNGGNTWSLINSPNDIGFLDFGGMSWVSLKKGYILYENQPGAGNQSKTLYYTDNGGKTWSIKSKSDFMDMGQQKVDNSVGLGGYGSGIKFFLDNVGYVGLVRGAIRKSTDGGETFKSITEYSDYHPLPSFLNSKEGYGVFEGTDLYHTTDGGNHWVKIISANNDLWNK